jgi:hypothetical protein
MTPRRRLLALAITIAAPALAWAQRDAAMLPRVGMLMSQTHGRQVWRIEVV